jgi:hypothetical protein
MSHNRKTSTPVAIAFRAPWNAFEMPLMRPTGSPMKMVAPAIAPSAAADP